MFKALMQVKWDKFGHKLKSSVSEDGREVSWFLSPLRDEYLPNEKTRLKPKTLIFIMDLLAEQVPFANLTKTSISKDACLHRIIRSGVSKVMQKLHKITSGLFMSTDLYFRHYAVNIGLDSLNSYPGT